MKTIRLFWWSEIILQGKKYENYGDLLGKYLVEKISGSKVVFAHPKYWSLQNLIRPIFVTIGSVLSNSNKYCIVWGSGIITKDQQVKGGKFLAVRGPETRKCLKGQGYHVPEVYGDPALLLPKYYNPIIKKKYKLGIVLHYVDYDNLKSEFHGLDHLRLIDLRTNCVETTTNSILECDFIISSSLHGLIIAHAYGIPAIWNRFSDRLSGDDIKFTDYFLSVGIIPYKCQRPSHELINLNNLDKLFDVVQSLPDQHKLLKICEGLMAVCPFKSINAK